MIHPFSTGPVKTQTGCNLSTIMFSTFHRACGENLQAGIDVRGDVPDIVLHGGVSVFQRDFDFPDGVQYRRVIPGKFLADVRQTQVGELADQIHGDLPGFGGTLVFLGAPEKHLVNGVELAYLLMIRLGVGRALPSLLNISSMAREMLGRSSGILFRSR